MGTEESKKRPLVFAYYVTGHGFGHATRVVEVARNLILAGHDVHVVTGAPDFVFTSEIQSPRLFLRKVLLDCGAVQADALTVDRLASLEKYSETAVVPRASILATEVEWLKSIKADFVVSDVVPVACRAAADAGIPSVCITNFRDIKDPEHPYSLEELKVITEDAVEVNDERSYVRVRFTPTVEHCSMATVIGLCLRVKLMRCLPSRYKVDIRVAPGSHATEAAVNKQLNDKERVAAALENPNLVDMVDECLAPSYA